jgi:hypothetical protein
MHGGSPKILEIQDGPWVRLDSPTHCERPPNRIKLSILTDKPPQNGRWREPSLNI